MKNQTECCPKECPEPKQKGMDPLVLLLLAFFLVALCGCGPDPENMWGEPLCKTQCHMQLQNSPEPLKGVRGWTCDTLQEAETASIAALQDKAGEHDPRFLSGCDAVAGYRVSIKPDWAWYADVVQNGKTIKRLIGGQTFCSQGVIEVGNYEPMASAITHEMAHAIQNCNPLPDIDPDDPDHSNWKRDGIYAADDSVHESRAMYPNGLPDIPLQ